MDYLSTTYEAPVNDRISCWTKAKTTGNLNSMLVGHLLPAMIDI